MKNFNDWNTKKIKIDSFTNIKHPKAGEIWWCRVGVNIGSEVYGKGREYTRPVLIINTDGNENFIGVPLSSKLKNTKYSCIIKTSDEMLHTVLVYQIRNFDNRRLKEKIYDLQEPELQRVKIYFESLWKI